MSDIAPLLLLLLCWFFFGSRLAKNKKAKEAAGKTGTKPAASRPKTPEAVAFEEAFSDMPPAAPAAEGPVRSPMTPSVSSPAQGAPVRSPMAPSLSLAAPSEGTSGWDRNYLPGSLGEDTLEGVDPCHDGQSEEMDRLRSQAGPDAPAPARGLTLSWAGNDVVRGFVYGEILNQKKSRL